MKNLSPEIVQGLRDRLSDLKREHEQAEQTIRRCSQERIAIEVLVAGSNSVTKEQKSFASRIREALGRLKKPSSPKEVAAELEKNSFKWNGTQPLGAVVGVELHRMAQSETIPVAKVGPGKYRIKCPPICQSKEAHASDRH